ncbi:MAG TPA: alpha/beta hydrolase [Nocardioides sp.]|nr:alpha/beta hydrolase [Nocardioides sp.]
MTAAHHTASGTSLFVRRWGRAGGTPLLFLHSLGPASSAAFLGLAAGPLEEDGYDVAAPDLPGYGGSPPIPADAYAVPALAEMIASLADDLGWDRFVLVGHSWGGAIACHLAAAHPARIRALVLVDSGHLDYADTPGADLTASVEDLIAEGDERRLRLADRADVVEMLEVEPDDLLVDAFLEGMEPDGDAGLVSRTPGVARGPALYHLARARQSRTWPRIAAAGIPVLLLLATRPDEARTVNEGGAARFAAAVPAAEVRWVEGATHSLVTDERERFGAAVADWLLGRS